MFVYIHICKEGKVPVLNYLSITPWRHMGEWRYCSTILDLGTRWRWVVSFTPRPLYPRGESTGTYWIGVYIYIYILLKSNLFVVKIVILETLWYVAIYVQSKHYVWIDSKRFWRWYITLGNTGFLGFVEVQYAKNPHRLTRRRKQIQFPKRCVI
jgi:hypothetical protein